MSELMTLNISIINTGAANLCSIQNALEYIGCKVTIASTVEDLQRADKLVLPGVGAFDTVMQFLKQDAQMLEALNDQVLEQKKPILGICLGMQLMATESYENGHHQGLGWIPATVRRLESSDKNIKIPHIGFNTLTYQQDCFLFNDIPPQPDFYFVHSYHVDCDSAYAVAYCDHGGDFVAAIKKDHMVATQFHPEKSQSIGLKLLENFARGEI